MKKIITLILLVLMCPFLVGAQEHSKQASTSPVSFSTKVSNILYYKDIKKTQFFIRAEDIVNSENIAYWKVQSYCDKRMTVQVTASSTNDCGKFIQIDSLADNSFYFLFGNQDNKTKNFSVKLKAYDKNGKWIHAERIGFGWK